MDARTVAGIQSSYIPWKGYFDQINMADVFVFYDDVQFTAKDWRSRNRIKTPHGLRWLSVPCGKDLKRRICDVGIESDHWQRKHWKSIQQSYGKARHFERYRGFFESLYLERRWTNLAEMNQAFIKAISREILGITTEFRDSREFDLSPDKRREERWLDLLPRIGAGRVIVGPKARDYLDDDARRKVRERGVEILWMDYSGYPEYRQLHPPFEHHVSIVDLIMNEGPEAPAYMLSFGRES
jgi:hypothetical protein